ncbi:MAG: NYN domain-containing protein [Candidatus Paceibacterota bacterium]
MKKKANNYAYIDGANLHKGVEEYVWELDYVRFRTYLLEKLGVQKAYLFLGLIPHYTNLYEFLQEAGYILVFKETTSDGSGNVKGNCDAELVLKAVSDTYEDRFDSAILVSGDGDFRCLVDFWTDRKKIKRIIAPNYKKCSILLKRTNVDITYLNDIYRHIMSQNEKAPDADGTA